MALWSEGQVLLVRESYREKWALPGGGIRRRENPIAAIIREAKEEVGITVTADELRYLGEVDWALENVTYHAHVYEALFMQRPAVHIDNREIIRAEWHVRETALKMDLTPQLHRYLQG